MEDHLLLTLLFFPVAILYSSAGFGGGSSYLALMALAGTDLPVLRSVALLCNLTVVTGGTALFYRQGYLSLSRSLPLVAVSVPFAFLGGYLPLPSSFIFIVLGFSLLAAALLLWAKPVLRRHKTSKKATVTAVSTGGLIGFLSGMVGIGGGIFLSPVLHLLQWDTSKKIAAVAGFFIFANSLAGLFGQWLRQPPPADLLRSWPLLLAVLLGGQVGSRMAVHRFSDLTVSRVTAILVSVAGLKILHDHLWGF